MRTALAAALALASSSAMALGLGQIELKSKLGEPLLAEIPIISNDPAELERLQAGLASPETFARIGLQPPDSVVANLQFVSALDAQGNPVIRVTSTQPIEQPLLTFLIEVDWGQGKLVREYSTLLDTPRTVSAPMQPPIDAPVVAPSNTIVREPEPAPAPATGAEPEGEIATAAPSPTGAEPQPTPDTAIDPIPPPSPAPAPVVAAPPPMPAGRPDEYGAVQAGETLSEIAQRLDYGATLDQAMIALLNANPEAFIGGNINLLKQGAVLRVPDAETVRGIEAAQAMAQVRRQTSAWRLASQPVPQPALADAPAEAAADDQTSSSATPTAGGARLEIVPPGASDAAVAGTQSGISAGAEGDMVRQQMQTQETLAARNAELAELKSRVADLEKLQSDQQKLLEMKDNELNAVQQRLAQTQDAEKAAGGAPGLPWLLGGVGLLLLGLLGGWWMRRRAEVTPKFRAPGPGTAPSPLAAGFPGGQAASVSPPTPPAASSAAPVAASSAASVAPAKAAGVAGDSPGLWDGRVHEPSPGKRPAPPIAVPTWHAGGGNTVSGAPASTRVEPPTVEVDTDAPGSERLELARAYLDLGDRDSARQLLGEVALNGDHSARQQATQMLRELD
ncbi:FimV/HubP family polar landmark protein [Novilysobacter erysipheiresistens]|uniref:FimV/HubP family polar landmark protein n=1 Tax=Novilysobacter erysipheiresistens TaxID=1749332 RepID=A0ABU7YV82_9GAMM